MVRVSSSRRRRQRGSSGGPLLFVRFGRFARRLLAAAGDSLYQKRVTSDDDDDPLARPTALLAHLEPGERLYEVIFCGGAILRESVDLNSTRVATLHPGELVVGLEEQGRRISVRTSDGLTGWMSSYTADGLPILRFLVMKKEVPVVRRWTCIRRALNGMVGLDSKVAPIGSRTEREAKWERIRVEADGQEAKPFSVRRGSPGMPLEHWRPPTHRGSPRGQSHSLPKQQDPSQSTSSNIPVPRLSAPPQSAVALQRDPKGVSTSAAGLLDGFRNDEVTKVKAVAVGEDLLDLSSSREPGLRSNLPSLIEALRGLPVSSGPGGSTRQERVGAKNTSDGIPDAPPSRGKSAVSSRTTTMDHAPEEAHDDSGVGATFAFLSSMAASEDPERNETDDIVQLGPIDDSATFLNQATIQEDGHASVIGACQEQLASFQSQHQPHADSEFANVFPEDRDSVIRRGGEQRQQKVAAVADGASTRIDSADIRPLSDDEVGQSLADGDWSWSDTSE
eukprot:TRINITY_DN18815_c0_g1_i1.p1 TRINITY_DN18815_c0_g1~~TRINITY_DN18815_c0_g1_i1.p1  ORF type:complete len:524 (+),score=68.16 TRINITY_DN18815_c0_g1_i1:56-1573(+)